MIDVPDAPTGRIARPELAGRLSASLRQGSILLIAGPGYGKTMVLEEALGAWQGASLKLVLTEQDGSAGHLLERLLAALVEAVPGAADVVAERVGAALEPVDVAAIRSQLVGDLDRLLVDPLAILFDDAEAVAESPAALAVIRELISSESRRLSVAVASRRALPLRSSELGGAARVLEIGESELLFTPEEIERLLRARLEREPAPGEVRSVIEATEGWPLGVALAVRAAPGIGFRSISSPRELRSFLEQEVLDLLDPELRDALIDASIVRELDPDLVAALGLPEGLVDEIVERRLLALRSDGGVRLHPLFRDFLRSRLIAERSQDEQRQLHRRAALGLERSGRGREAVDHWIEAAAAGEATGAVAREGPALVRSAPELVSGWIERLPPASLDQPGVLTLRGQLALADGELELADELLERAASAHRQAGDPAGDWAARFERSLAFYFRGMHEEVGEIARDFDPTAPECASPAALATATYAAGGVALWGRFADAEALAKPLFDHPASGLMAPLDCIREVYAELPAGRLEEAMRRVEAAVETLERSDPMGQMPYLLVAGAHVLGDQGRDEEALEWWQRAAGAGEQLGQALIATSARAWSATELAHAGRLAEAERELAHAERARLSGWRRYDVELARATLAGMRGESQPMLDASERAARFVEPGPPADRVWMATGLAPLLAALGRADRARALVQSALDYLDALIPGPDARFWRARLLAHRGWLHAREGDEEAGAADLHRAIETAGDALRGVLRRDWAQLEAGVWSALGDGTLEVGPIIAELGRAWPEGGPLVALLDHPAAEVRRAALVPAIGSGDPEASRRALRLVEDPAPSVSAAATAALDRVAVSTAPLVYRMLGRFEVRRGGWLAEPGDWGRPAASRLVRYLLVHRDHAVAEEQLFEALWPGKEPSTARRTLHVALSRARAVLDQPGAEPSRLEALERTYRLRVLDRDMVDAGEFDAAVTVALAEEGPTRLPLLERVDRLWTGEPLPEDRYADWAIPWRERLIDRFLAVLAALAGERSAQGDEPGAIHALQRLVELDPLHEQAHGELMRAFARSGRRAQALRQYLECRRVLVDRLGIEPSQATSRLQARILAGEPV